ncbi:MAG: SPFH domain-containing protein [Anaerolineales bacterium]
METFGRKKTPAPIDFGEDEVIRPGPDLNVNPLIEATYVPLPPKVFGAITAPDGARLIIHVGGMYDLGGGKYHLHYIDQRERTRVLENIEGTTSDGFKVKVRVQFSYRVSDPEKVLDVDKPVQTLLTTIETAVKNYIISHTHDEIIRPQDSDDSLDERMLEKYVLRQLAQNSTCRGFTVSSLALQDWVGDPKNLELRQKSQIIEKESLNKQKQLHLEQSEAEKQKELEIKKGEVEQTKAEAEYRVEQVMNRIRQLKIELEQMRSLPDRRHKEILQVIEAIKEMPGFPRNANDSRILQELTNTLLEKTERVDQTTPKSNGRNNGSQTQEQKVSDLAQTILGLVRPKNK